MVQPHCVLITGGCGFIGSNFINFVFNKWPSTSFVNIDKLADGIEESSVDEKIRQTKRYKFIKNTAQNLDLVVRTLKENKVDMVINFAAVTHVDESYSDRIGTITENVLSTTVILEALVFHYPFVKRFIHISTDEIYGDSKDCNDIKTEDSLPNPTNPYAASKAACEQILTSYWHSFKVPFVMVRMNNIYGPHQCTSKLIPKFIKLAIESKSYPLIGDGQHTRSWIYVDDCAEAIRRISLNGRIGEIYNIGTEIEHSNYDVTLQIHENVNKILKRKSNPAKFEYVQDRPYHDRRYLIDSTKISTELNWQCETPFEIGLVKTIQHYLQKHRENSEEDRLKG